MTRDPETLRSNAEGEIPENPFVDKRRFISQGYLSEETVYKRLWSNEWIQYLLLNRSKEVTVESLQGNKQETHASDRGLSSIAAVTDRRVLILVGQHNGDHSITLKRGKILGTALRGGLLSTELVIRTVANTYTFPVKKRESSYPEAAVEYIKSQLITGQPQQLKTNAEDEMKSQTTDSVSPGRAERVDGGIAETEQAPAATGSGLSRTDLLEDIRQVRDHINRRPNSNDIGEYGTYSQAEYGTVFSSWEAAFEAALSDTTDEEVRATGSTERDKQPQTDESGSGSESGQTTSAPTKEEFLTEIARVAAELEKRPTMGEFDDNGRFDSSDVYDHFDGWGDAIDAAEIEGASRRDLLSELHRLQSELGFPPLSTHVNDLSQFSAYDYQLEFGSVDEALEAAGIDVRAHVVETLSDIVDRSDGKPTMAAFGKESPYSQSVIYKFFESWDDAVAAVSPTGATEPVDGEADDTATPDVVQNELSERYELLRNLQTLVSVVADVREEYTVDDEMDPMVEWAATVDDFWRNGRSDTNNYGAQQNERNPFSMQAYREAFGTGDRVTGFEVAPSTELSPTLMALLDPLIEADLDTFHLPVDDESDSPMPVIVESTAELRRALEMFAQLPAAPTPATQHTSTEGTASDSETLTPTPLKADPPAPDLLEVNGVTEQAAKQLQAAGYHSQDGLRTADMDELAAVDGIGRQLAMRIKLDVGD